MCQFSKVLLATLRKDFVILQLYWWLFYNSVRKHDPQLTYVIIFQVGNATPPLRNDFVILLFYWWLFSSTTLFSECTDSAHTVPQRALDCGPGLEHQYEYSKLQKADSSIK